MKKLINEVDNILNESLLGFSATHSEIVSYNSDPRFIYRKGGKTEGKVSLISGGGSGHEPLHAGLVGIGMLDAACPGQMEAAAKAVDGGAGILFIVKNYSGDVMNFELAAEILDIPNKSILTNDDVAVEDSSFTTGRRGVAGTLVVEKVVGAAAESGLDLEECLMLGNKVNSHTRSMGVALSSCTVPAVGKPTFELAKKEMEMGVGIHGEPGRETMELPESPLDLAQAPRVTGCACSMPAWRVAISLFIAQAWPIRAFAIRLAVLAVACSHFSQPVAVP